jgi:TonB-dependent Receptor Plug Domain.
MATKKNPNQIEHFLSLDLENINSLKMPMLKAIILFLLLSNCLFAFTQKIVSSKIKENLVQDLKGIVIDRVLQTPISGATITLLPEGRTIVSDSNGNFNLKQVPIGVHQLLVSHIEYTDVLLDNININVGKATVVNVAMDMNIRKNEPVVIKAISRRNKPLNDMSIVSTRAFTVEETQRYAAAVNDPSRMAQGFPGVMVLQDANNDIIIRGNSPTGLLWRMEGVDIPNPNHFASAGSSGGGISILSSQLMANSDFLTGAFAAEYGDALSGVFDIKLRKGNNEKNEYTFQAGLIGLNLSAEGPFNSSYTGSYLINYRYSTLEILNRIGIHLNEGNTNFQDLSYNIYLPTSKSGIFTFFGFGGLSSKAQLPLLDSTQWISEGKRYSSANYSNTGASGITHKLILSNNTSLASAIAYSYNNLDSKELYVERDYTLTNKYRDSYKTSKLTITSTLNHKFSSRSSLRMGSTVKFDGL